jgi:hypothetical protein
VLECPSCSSFQIFKVEEFIVEVSIFYIPVEKYKKAIFVRCDFCNSAFASPPDITYVSLNDWSFNDGFSRLLDSIDPDNTIKIPEDVSDANLHSLLRYVVKSKSLSDLELSTTWLAIGGLVSLPIAITIAMLLYDRGIIKTIDLDRFGFIALFSIFGFVVGALLIGTIRALSRSKRIAFDHLQATYKKYKLNLSRLDTLSRSYSNYVRSSVGRLCHKEIFSVDGKEHGL